MQLTKLSIILSFAAVALAGTPVKARAPQAPQETPSNNANRPVPTGACCVANTSLRQDVCTDAAGASGRCVPSGSAGCESSLSSSPSHPRLGWVWPIMLGNIVLTIVFDI